MNLTVPNFNETIEVTSVDGWMVVQQRFNNETSFRRNWTQYRDGFGEFDGNFWIGLEAMHQLTESSHCQLRIEVFYAALSQWRSAEYSSFVIDSESANYTLHVAGYSGDADDNLNYANDSKKYHNGMKFSTEDRDNDRSLTRNCALIFAGGWWFNDCHSVDLTGIINVVNPNGNSFEYYIGGFKAPVRISRMMLQRVS